MQRTLVMKTLLPLSLVALVASLPVLVAADILGIPVLASIGLMPALMSYLAVGLALIIQDSYGSRRVSEKRPASRRAGATASPRFCLEPHCQGRAA